MSDAQFMDTIITVALAIWEPRPRRRPARLSAHHSPSRSAHTAAVTTSPSYWWHEAGIVTCAEDVGTTVVPNTLNTCVRVPAAKCSGWRSQWFSTGEAWILGFAAENVGVTAARREVTIAPHRDEAKAVDYLTIHFCSDECRQNYMAQLFRGEPPKTEVVEEVVVVPTERRIVREYPERRIETVVARHKPAKKKPTHKRRKAA